MELSSPPGYGAVVPLDKEKHAGLGITPDAGRFAAGLNAVYLTIVEFFVATRDYPLVFIADAASGTFLPVAITGLITGQNLFVGVHGRWRHGSYVPAYVRRYPFCTVQLPDPDAADPSQFLICVDERALSADEPALFDSGGSASEEWRRREALINDMEAARLQTEAFARRLAELSLLEPFEAQIHPRNAAALGLKGMHRVAEARLNGLPGETLKQLMSEGALSRIYAHLISLDNFARLLDMLAEGREAPQAD